MKRTMMLVGVFLIGLAIGVGGTLGAQALTDDGDDRPVCAGPAEEILAKQGLANCKVEED